MSYTFIAAPAFIKDAPRTSDTEITVDVAGFNKTYQWFSNTTCSINGGTAISGANEATYVIPETATAPCYYCAITSFDNNPTTPTTIYSRVTCHADIIAAPGSKIKFGSDNGIETEFGDIIYGLQEYEWPFDVDDYDDYVTATGGATLVLQNNQLGCGSTGAQLIVKYNNVEVKRYTVVGFGDLNGDYRIESCDLSIFSDIVYFTPFSHWTESPLENPYAMAADINGNGVYDRNDITYVSLASEYCGNLTNSYTSYCYQDWDDIVDVVPTYYTNISISDGSDFNLTYNIICGLTSTSNYHQPTGVSNNITPISGASFTVTPYLTGYEGTGTTVTVRDVDDVLVKRYKVIVFGDLDGDGDITLDDRDIISAYIDGTFFIPSGSPKFIAGDLNHDGDITQADYTLIDNVINGTNTIDQTTGTVVGVPVFTQNTPTYITSDDTAISVSVTGTSKSYRWYYNTTNSSTGGTAIQGATSETYTLPETGRHEYYYCVVTSTVDGVETTIKSNVTAYADIVCIPGMGLKIGSENGIETEFGDIIYGLPEYSWPYDLTSFGDYITATGGATYELANNSFQRLGTGAQIVVKFNNVEVKRYTIIVFGDINGDFCLDGTDQAIYVDAVYSTPYSYWAEAPCENPYAFAADINGNGDIERSDLTYFYLASQYIGYLTQSYSSYCYHDFNDVVGVEPMLGTTINMSDGSDFNVSYNLMYGLKIPSDVTIYQPTGISDNILPISGATFTVTPYLSGYEGTGTTVTVRDTSDTVIETYTVIVFGDLDGDGSITQADRSIIWSHIAGSITISSGTPQFIAGDINQDGYITMTDYTCLGAVINGVATIDQTTGTYTLL